MQDQTVFPVAPKTIYVSIGNSDNRLTQAEWAQFYARVDHEITSIVESHDGTLYGRWVSASTDVQQNACWGFAEPDADVWDGSGGVREYLRETLQDIAADYRQDSIAWTEGSAELIAANRA